MPSLGNKSSRQQSPLQCYVSVLTQCARGTSVPGTFRASPHCGSDPEAVVLETAGWENRKCRRGSFSLLTRTVSYVTGREALERKGEKVTLLTTFMKHSGSRLFLQRLVSALGMQAAVNPTEKTIPWEQSSTRRHRILGLCGRAHEGVFVLGREWCGIPWEDPRGVS